MPLQCILQMFREPSVDTKVIVASGPDTIVIAFRGTASWANVVSDLQVRSCWRGRCILPIGLRMKCGQYVDPVTAGSRRCDCVTSASRQDVRIPS